MRYQELHPSFTAWMQEINTRLPLHLAGEHPTLRDAGHAVVGSRGKRLRPLLLLFACDSVGGVVNDRVFTHSTLIEMIHTATLAHDDVVDESRLRRGVPSAPARWGNKFSILLGDYLLARVFELATEDGNLEILRILAGTAAEMGRAVVLESAHLNLHATEEIYWNVIRGKTAALFAAAASIGAVLGEATPAQHEALFRLGTAFGCAFQLADDLMDLQGVEEDTGKPHGNDWDQRKATLPLLHALHAVSPEVASSMRALWLSELITDEELQTLRGLVEAAGGFEYSWQKVKEYQEEACGYLGDLPAGSGRDALWHLCTDAFPLPVMPTAV